jgi:diaminopimelate decarboxylase
MRTHEELASTYGSPLYVYELDTLRANLADLTAALPARSTVLYSLKANPHARLVRELATHGCGAEVSSLSELRTAVDAGVGERDVLYTGPGKSRAEITAAVRAGSHWFSVDSAPQLDAVRAVADDMAVGLRVLLRVNPDHSTPGSALVMTGVASPFGLDADQILAEPSAFAPTTRCQVVGLHFYLGSGVPDAAALAAQFAASIRTAVTIQRRLGFDWEVLDLGGGFPRSFACSDERPGLAGLREALDDALAAVPGAVRVLFESGRYLVGSAGHLVATVVDVKRSKGRWFAILDSGINHLGGMAGLGRLPRMQPEIIGVGESDEQVSIVGPLCTPLDWWTRSGQLRPQPGALIVVPNTGAYGLTASLVAFLGRDCPGELVLDHGEVVDASVLSYARQPLVPEGLSTTVEETP